ncbi:putative RNA-directed DNA polymerase [Senna tora]|uniref:Putative RNA-directed DNA polymerase n=1 Tax=Senna tora TaxID=362788 RepID=A0A834WJ46_9FABA|nr:putative RNA-directed DNA polymerase [Senna tora]
MLPKSVINQIEKLERAFLWGSSSKKKQCHQIGWNKICIPKALGGLGILSLREMNMAFLAVAYLDDNLWDVPIWNHVKDSYFTTKIAYLNIRKLEANNSPSVWNTIWKGNNQYRHKLLLWRICHNSLPTRSKTASWNGTSAICPSYFWDWRNMVVNESNFIYPNEPHRVILNIAKKPDGSLERKVQIKHIPRTSNTCADILAKRSLATRSRVVIFHSMPEFVKDALFKDAQSDVRLRDPGG